MRKEQESSEPADSCNKESLSTYKKTSHVPSHKEKEKEPIKGYINLITHCLPKHQSDILASVANDAIVPGIALARG